MLEGEGGRGAPMRGRGGTARVRALRTGAIAIALVALAAAPPAAATHWTGSGTLSPLRAFSGERVTFDFLLNNSAAERLEVFSVKMIACWHGAGGGSYIKPDDGTSLNISASGSFEFV